MVTRGGRRTPLSSVVSIAAWRNGPAVPRISTGTVVTDSIAASAASPPIRRTAAGATCGATDRRRPDSGAREMRGETGTVFTATGESATGIRVGSTLVR
jgi:hypothetical protein